MALGIKSTPVAAEIGDLAYADSPTKVYSNSALTGLAIDNPIKGDEIGVIDLFNEKYIRLKEIGSGNLIYIGIDALYTPKANPAYNYPAVPPPSTAKPPSPSGDGSSILDVVNNGLKALLTFFGGGSTPAPAVDTNGDGVVNADDTQTPTPPVEKTALQKAIPFVGGAVVLGVIGYFLFRVKKPKVQPVAVATATPPVAGLGKVIRQKL